MEKIKLLLILEASLGGTRKHVFDLLKYIELEQFDVTFCYSTVRADNNFFIELEEMRNRGIRFVEIPMYREISFIKDFISLIKIYKLIKKERFKIVHTHSSKAGFLGRIAAKLVSRKIITIYTPNSLSINISRVYKYIEKIAMLFTDRIIAVSESEKKEIIDAKITSNVEKINSGVEVFSTKNKNKIIQNELKLNDNTLIVVSVGRLTKQKDPLTFFMTVKDFINTYNSRSVFFVWIGDGELRSIVDVYIQAYGISNYCKILGWRTDVDELLWGADVFILTSIYESFGYVTCEAMSHFLPVIATNVVGTSDIVIDKECGFLVDVGDYKSISKNLNILIQNENLREEMGKKGNNRIREHFNVIDMVKNTERLYLKLLRINNKYYEVKD